ncbi:ABC transporter ATP-binding protein [Alteribacillus iranensis]|uniref:Energy-coupling factor transport system ATP-binding protein n=1 Tax=Alteribacillus iranensis TaxID=930128 RepID=A0A1I2BMK0_9BACI|nr:ABC transporter ATP-binding protein [Alteribacillus iranensis]SFE57229.1 energy-coupling factor transport system ATP-binding protein [Alteribacillus iranensis]
MSIIEATDVSITFGLQKRPSLRHVTFFITKGETVLLLGPSGCGKSTLAHALQGLIPRSVEADVTGTLSVKGEHPATWTPREAIQHVGILFQDPETQFCMLTVEDEILFGLENLGLSREEMEERLERSLAYTGLVDRRHEALNKLSGGLKQKAAIACLLALDPDIFVLDEPTANLDPKSSDDILRLFADIARDPSKTVIFIEHQLDPVLPVIDRVIALSEKEGILAEGSPREIFTNDAVSLQQEGIWLPQVCMKALELEKAGKITWPTLPLSLKEWQAACEKQAIVLSPSTETETVPSVRTDAPIMEAESVCFSYKNQTVLEDVYFSIASGEFTVLVGANGAGKSTLAKVIAGIHSPTHGVLRRNGEDQQRMSRAELFQRTGYVFQQPEHQFVTDTVEEELSYGWKITDTPAAEWQQDVENKLDEFRLQEKRMENPFSLSQGQKRRLSVASMLSPQQDVLILDEPTFGQDEASTVALMKQVKQLHDEGQTIVMITHDMELVARYAEKVLLVEEGTITYEGPIAPFFNDRDRLEKAALKAPLSWELERWERAMNKKNASTLTCT